MSGSALLESTTLWYGVAVAIFAILFMWKGWKPITGWLDGEINKIHAELDEAKRLHAEAEATLKDYQSRQEVAEKEAARIVEQAKIEAQRLRAEAERDMQVELERHESLAINRIKLAESDAQAEVRSFIVKEVMREVREKVSASGAASNNAKLVDNIIADIPKMKA